MLFEFEFKFKDFDAASGTNPFKRQFSLELIRFIRKYLLIPFISTVVPPAKPILLFSEFFKELALETKASVGTEINLFYKTC